MIYPLVTDLADEGIPVALTCRLLGFSKQAYFKWRANPVTQRDWDDAHLLHAAREVHHDDPEFGYRFIADELPCRGVTASRNRVSRLCSQQRLWSVHAKKRGLSHKPGPPVHDDLVERSFTADATNRLWVADFERHEAFANPGGGGRPSRDACRSRHLKLEDDRLPGRGGGWWSSPRQRRVVLVLPDGAGSASETERHTRGTSG